jgi:hypothetical protein
VSVTPDWNNHLDEIAKHVLAMQRLALNCGDIMQSAALLKTIERLDKRVADSRLNLNDAAGSTALGYMINGIGNKEPML